MDPRRFDALVQSLVVPASRRHILAGLLAFLPALDAEAKRKQRGQRQAQDREKNKTKKRKQQRKQQRKRARAEAAPGCCQSGTCTAGTGKNLTKCCFEEQDLTGRSFKGSNLTGANFRNAILTNAKFQSSNLTGACFVGATITGANFKGANLSGVIKCGTITANGEDNSGCDRGTPCCPTCENDESCVGNEVCFQGNCCTPEDDPCSTRCGDTTDNCGQAIECPPCAACSGQPNGTPCEDPVISRCCDGTCFVPEPCRPVGACCETEVLCSTQCCTQHGAAPAACPSGAVCTTNLPPGPCAEDSDCIAVGGIAICVCGQCCGQAGADCFFNNDCCSGVCNGPSGCAA